MTAEKLAMSAKIICTCYINVLAVTANHFFSCVRSAGCGIFGVTTTEIRSFCLQTAHGYNRLTEWIGSGMRHAAPIVI